MIEYAGGFDLALPDAIGRMDDLALQVADVDDVEVDETDGPDAGGGKVQRCRASEPAGPDQQRLRFQQLLLPGGSDLGDEQVAAVALLLLLAEDDGTLEFEPRALPGLEATGHACHVGVAHLCEGLGREERPDAARAVQDHRGVTIRGGALDLLLDVALRDVMGAWDEALLPFGGLAHVDDRCGAAGRASTSWAVTSRILLRASRRRSA